MELTSFLPPTGIDVAFVLIVFLFTVGIDYSPAQFVTGCKSITYLHL
jgi:hypothetical protein